MEWISVEDRLPHYGEPVIIVANRVVQNITYVLDGADDTKDWFEPYHFEHENSLKLWYNKATYWAYLPEPPK